jgi:histidyl-tRNA synthetase
MSESINKFIVDPVKGFRDTHGLMAYIMETMIKKAIEISQKYGIQPIYTPIIERESLFVKSLGNESDIVGKEIFRIISEDRLILRPEQTSSIIRWASKNRIDLKGQTRVYSYGPMFRHENPQKGRWRQFYQFNVEFINSKNTIQDAEMILMTKDFFDAMTTMFNLPQHLFTLKINWIGTKENRKVYCQYLQENILNNPQFSPEAQIKAKTNPIRVLDTKNPEDIFLLKQLKPIEDFLDENSLSQWNHLRNLLDTMAVPYEWDSFLVRGLDYYNDLVLEWVINDDAFTKSAVLAGGRYDALAYFLTNKYHIPSIGFAIGLDRLADYIAPLITQQASTVIGICNMDASDGYVLKVAQKLRKSLNVEILNQKKLSDNLKYIDNNQDIFSNKVVVIGSLEEDQHSIIIKDLNSQSQQNILLDRIEDYEF